MAATVLTLIFPEPAKRGTANNTTGTEVSLTSQATRAKISNTGGQILRVYFTQTAFDADVALAATDGYIDLPATTGYMVYEGSIRNIWFRAAAATTTFIVLVTYR